MKICRYWARVDYEPPAAMRLEPITAIGWSQVSEADAEQRALERAKKLAELLARGGDDYDGPHREDYYADRPLREPIVEEHRIGEQVQAVITRNVYGAFVLNAANVMFIDIDRPQQKSGGLFGRLFGKKQAEPTEDPTLERIGRVIGGYPHLAMRLYETAAGYRGVITNRTFEPTADETHQLLTAFESDELYVRLCRSQECFRARLSPKPFRIGMPNPPRQYPWIDEDRRRDFEQWDVHYQERATAFRVCDLVETFGSGAVHADVQPVLDIHDAYCCMNDGSLA